MPDADDSPEHAPDQPLRSPAHRASPPASRWRTALRVAGWTSITAYFLVAALVLVLRYTVLPDIGRHAPDIERAASQAIGKRVTIGGIEARWIGVYPEVELKDVRIHDDQGRVALSLPAVEAVIGLRSLALMSLRLNSLAIEQPNLDVRRDRYGRLFVAGLQMQQDDSSPGLSTWLLSQNEIVVRNARVSWDDEQRGAPTLDLFGVTFMLRNSGDLHRVGLRAQTTRELGSSLDVRAEVRGESLARRGDWRGLVFADLDHVELGAWKQWIDYPVDVQSGSGALRLWLAFDGERITEATADVELENVHARLASDLPLLELDYVRGRLGAADTGGIVDAQARRVTLQTKGGVALPPADLSLHWERAASTRAARGELKAAALEVEPLVRLAEYLPLPLALRQHLSEHEPRASLHDLRVAWTGEVDAPERYTVRSRFSGAGIKAHGVWGGFEGLAGTVEANESGGSLQVDARSPTVVLPAVVAQRRLDLDTLAAQVSWSRPNGTLQLKIGNITLANAEVAANLHGTYATRSIKPGGPGTVDLSGVVQRLDGKAAWKHIPFLPSSVQEYLHQAIVAGNISDGRFRLKGDLRDFPFADAKTGTFKVNARVANAEFQYAVGWPRMTGMTADVALDGTQLAVSSPRATLLGARLSNVRASIADLYHGDARLRVDGQADGATPDFLRFVRTSPLENSVGRFLKTLTASGTGRLQLALQLPITGPSPLKVNGTYDFNAGQVLLSTQVPPFAQAIGRVEFTESGAAIRNASAQFLGGPASFTMATRADGAYAVTGQGTVTIAALRRQFDVAALDRASGSAPWRASLTIAAGGDDLVIESPLTGVAIALPPPFSKAAAEAMPLRVERSTRADAELVHRARIQRLPADGDAIAFSLGRLANGVVVRRRAGDALVIERGSVGVNEPAAALPAAGVAVTGRIAYLDADRWKSFLPTGGDTELALSSVALNATLLDVAGKRFNDVRLRASPDRGGWSAEVVSRELDGSLSWRPEGRGRVVARLRQLTVPEAAPTPAAQELSGSELPAIDVVANEFSMRGIPLGRLELTASNEARDWRIEKLSLSAADGTFAASGVWQSWAVRPSVNLNVKLDLRDVGAFLTRVGFPGAVRGGTAALEGRLGWVGSPQSIDYPTLTGNVSLNAARGQFLKAEPGIAKLLGILSLQSWITLDFRELFGEGFAFETLSSTAQISKGLLSTGDFRMSGKAAHVSMAGVVDLARETQKLRVRVVPALGDSVSSVAGLLLANPVAGLGAMVAQRLFKDPLGRIFALEYAVNGTWTDPVVERLGAQRQAIDNPP